MDVYVFSSKNLTNIWAGIGARLWAVAQREESASASGRATKAQNLRVGSLGLLYCVETHSLTTPFIVYSKPHPTKIISDVWPESWVLPFKMLPLGNPELQLSSDEAKSALPIFKEKGEGNLGNVFHVQAVTAFSPSKIELNDWEILIERLAVNAR